MSLDRNTGKKRIIFCTYSSIYSSIVLEKLLADDEIDVVGIINSTRLHHSQLGQIRGSVKQIQLSGWHYSIYLFLITDVFSWLQPFFTLKTIKHLAKMNEIPFINSRDINQADGITFIKHSSANVLLAAHFNQRVKTEILNMPELQCINIHPSKLPDYKGVDPVFFAHLNDENAVGVSVHKMEEQFDTGAVLIDDVLSLKNNQSLFTLNKMLFSRGATLAIQWLKSEDVSKINETTLDKGSYDSWPTPEQIKKFKEKGKFLFKLKELLNV